MDKDLTENVTSDATVNKQVNTFNIWYRKTARNSGSTLIAIDCTLCVIFLCICISRICCAT